MHLLTVWLVDGAPPSVLEWRRYVSGIDDVGIYIARDGTGYMIVSTTVAQVGDDVMHDLTVMHL